MSSREHTLKSGERMLQATPPQSGCWMSIGSAPFFHRSNADGTYNSICMRCYRTVDTQPGEGVLAMKEKVHVCNQEDLLSRGLTGKEDHHPA
jgi:hypothetical protein